jgi:hypothetical protein
MACPHVSGVLALGKSYRENATSMELVDCLTSTAVSVDEVNVAAYEGKLGAGLIHAVIYHDEVHYAGSISADILYSSPFFLKCRFHSFNDVCVLRVADFF